MSKKIIFGIIVAIIAILIIYQNFLKKEEAPFSLFEAVRGNITQEVSETGQVKVGEEIRTGVDF